MRQSGMPENEWKERRDFERRKTEVEEKWEVLERRCDALRKSEKELSYA
jgi:chaperonin cofactor prefoldin